MKTIRARELTKDLVIVEDNNDRTKIARIDVTRRGSIMLWVGNDGATVKFYNPLDVVVVE